MTTLIDYEQFCGIVPARRPAPAAFRPSSRPPSRSSRRASIAAIRSGFSTSASPRVRHLPHPGVDPDPAGRAAEAARRVAAGRRRAGDRRPLQDGRAQREGRRTPARPASRGSRTCKGGILEWIERSIRRQSKDALCKTSGLEHGAHGESRREALDPKILSKIFFSKILPCRNPCPPRPLRVLRVSFYFLRQVTSREIPTRGPAGTFVRTAFNAWRAVARAGSAYS